ncbi:MULTISPECIES: MBL fold metallo-hydrolase [Prauserella salsuginis group]|uniref:Glyoxylase-like metal-dependent hydrolase (Beta-lactamase superfamily II) n=2 Tax=Prauserella salsuginis group TaxID=2893672 RepID=A0A839XSC3_9PSEU|nr:MULTISPECIES: MBL fold metallo-hydrolase [Prauserella salsuginis group]MBB3662876.1 glyoxylase-like metal-dependent hydrolase (beta-lactamase superfamily II) [Prauserella sediminis]MCR3720573.1 Metallo-beta-lactamase superfamily protein [Prauserella flava]MCR3733717.1 Metallo-beta-lactamase superfamily protein [Prauserella salsuginis]
MRKIADDLWETEPEYPFPGLSTHAYLWLAPAGNVLFYNTTHDTEFDRMAELGGVADHYLSHQDEIAPSLRTIKERFGSTLHTHATEADLASEVTPVDDAFEGRHVTASGIDVIPTPGHTPGSACFLVPVSGRTYLFTGDTLYVDPNGHWRAGYIPGMSDHAQLTSSLGDLATLEPDVVVSSAFAGDSGVTELGERRWADCVQEALAALEPQAASSS